MPKALGAVANVYNEINALPGWLENVSQWADDIQVYHAGPGGALSDDGTIELLEKWRIPIHRGSIDEGFGIVRTAAVRASKCDYVMLLDADERFYPFVPTLQCSGESTPPDVVNQVLQEYDCRDQGACPSNWENLAKLGANLKVQAVSDAYNQIAWLRSIIEHGALDAVKTIRRHWHDFTWKRPTQNWHTTPDCQIRLVRNDPSIHWDANTRMHEQLIGASNVYMPNQTHGPFFDHFHLFYKRMEPKQRAHDIAVYDAVHQHRPSPTWEEFRKERGL